jgi:hypothetical protein
MATRSLGTLTVDLVAKTGGFVQGMTEAERESAKSSKKIQQQWKEAGKAVEAGIKIGVAAFAAATAALTVLTVRSLSAIDANAKLAISLGTTSEALANVRRAGELAGVSFEQIETTTKKLTGRLSEAAAGAGPAVQALNRLGLTAEYLQGLPLDERLSRINAAIRDTIPAAEQAAVAADLFGERGGLAISRLSPKTIRQAKDEVKALGLGLSEIDTQKVQQANDAFSTMKLAATGLGNAIAVELAPIIRQVGVDFFNAASQATAMREIVASVKDVVFGVAAALISLADLIVRPFRIAGAVIESILVGLIALQTKIFNGLVKTVNFVTFGAIDAVDKASSQLSAFDAAISATFGGAGQRVADLFTEPLAGADFSEWVSNAESAARRAAAAAEDARSAVLGGPSSAGGGGGAAPASGDAMSASASKDIEAINNRLNALRQSFFTEEQLLSEKFVNEQALLAEEMERRKGMWEEYDSLALQSRERYENALSEIEQKAADARRKMAEDEANAKKAIYSDMFSNLTSLMNSQSKKLFNLGKTAALAQAVISAKSAILGAYDKGNVIGGPILGAAYAATAALFTGQQIQAIRSASFGGGGGGSGGAPSAGVTNTQAINAATEPVINRVSPTVDLRITGSSRLSLDEVADAMEQIGERLADSGGRLGKVTVLTA